MWTSLGGMGGALFYLSQEFNSNREFTKFKHSYCDGPQPQTHTYTSKWIVEVKHDITLLTLKRRTLAAPRWKTKGFQKITYITFNKNQTQTDKKPDKNQYEGSGNNQKKIIKTINMVLRQIRKSRREGESDYRKWKYILNRTYFCLCSQ